MVLNFLLYAILNLISVFPMLMSLVSFILKSSNTGDSLNIDFPERDGLHNLVAEFSHQYLLSLSLLNFVLLERVILCFMPHPILSF